MRDSQQNSGLHQHINGGKDPNYLVRSWASRLGTVTQGHKLPKSGYRSKWLQRLNHVELMQNVEVQQTLRNVMSILRAGDELMQDAGSVYEFAERRRIKKCHETVCKIRAEGELNKLSNLSTKDEDDSEIKASHQRGNDRKNNKQKKKSLVTSLEDNAKINRKFTNNTTITHHDNLDDIYKTFAQEVPENNKKFTNNTTITHCDNLDDVYKTFTQEVPENNKKFTNNTTITHCDNLDDIYEAFTQEVAENTNNNNNEPSMNQAEITNNNNHSMNRLLENHGERKAFLPPIPEKLTFNKERKTQNDHSLPTLDTESKFSIIKRARELRNERSVAQVKSQNLSLMSSQLQRKYSKAREISRKIEIFGDHRKILAEESKTDKNETTPATLPLLDSKSFSNIDCNDFLNLKNRLDSLSPAPAVLDHKLHWPTKTKDTFK